MVKAGNCHSGLFFRCSSKKGWGLSDRLLHIPEKWFDAGFAVLRQECAVSQELNFQIQNELNEAIMKDADQ